MLTAPLLRPDCARKVPALPSDELSCGALRDPPVEKNQIAQNRLSARGSILYLVCEIQAVIQTTDFLDLIRITRELIIYQWTWAAGHKWI